jgi:hypothetical protein
MSKDAMLPCIGCGLVLQNAFDLDGASNNQPSGGTEFRTFGHYGSTFWDSFAGEELVVNICDGCLRTWAERLARHKRFVKLVVDDPRGTIKVQTVVGRQWVDREMVPYFDGPEDEDSISIEPEEIGVLDREGLGHYERIEWVRNWRDIKTNIMTELAEQEDTGDCRHEHVFSECLDCGAKPLGLG